MKNIVLLFFVFFVNLSYADSTEIGVINLALNLQEIKDLVVFFAKLVGVILIFHFFVELKKESEAGGQQRATTFGIKPFWGMVLGVSLMSFEWALNTISYSIYPSTTSATDCLNSSITNEMTGILYIIKFVGLVFSLKALIILWHISKGESGQHSLRQAFSWLIWGAFAMNIEYTTWLLYHSLGGDSLNSPAANVLRDFMGSSIPKNCGGSLSYK